MNNDDVMITLGNGEKIPFLEFILFTAAKQRKLLIVKPKRNKVKVIQQERAERVALKAALRANKKQAKLESQMKAKEERVALRANKKQAKLESQMKAKEERVALRANKKQAKIDAVLKRKEERQKRGQAKKEAQMKAREERKVLGLNPRGQATEATKKKMRETRAGWRSGPQYHSEAAKKKMVETHLKYTIITPIGVFESMNEAGKAYGVSGGAIGKRISNDPNNFKKVLKIK